MSSLDHIAGIGDMFERRNRESTARGARRLRRLQERETAVAREKEVLPLALSTKRSHAL
jgi:hypothetical protein